MIQPYQTLRHGLVGAWCPSLSGSGRVLRDFGPLGLNATFVRPSGGNPAWEGSGTGLAYRSIASVGDIRYWSVPTTLIDSVPVTWSIALWFNATATQPRTDYAILSHLAVSSPFNGWMLYPNNSNNNIALYINSGFRATATGAFIRSTWRHLGATSDGETVRIFVDGRQAASGAYAVAPSVSGHPFAIGRYGSGAGVYDGLLDDIRYYARTLAPNEMAVLASQRGIGLLPRRRRRASVSGSQFHVNVNGTWKSATPWVNVSGTWKQATPSVNVSGTWK